MKFVETSLFARRITSVMPDDEYRTPQQALLRRPEQGDLIENSGGIRKVRWGGEGRGKRGGVRVIDYVHTGRETFLMLYVYRKNEQNDLTAEQRRALAKVVKQELK